MDVVERHRLGGRQEHDRGRLQLLRPRAWVVGRIGRAFGLGAVARGLDELAELGIGHRRPVDPEPLHLRLMGWRLLGVVVV